MEGTVLNPPPTTEAPAAFTADDRCDRCGAQAKARVVMASGNDLLFCGHHATRNEPALIAQGGRIERGPEDYAGTPGASA